MTEGAHLGGRRIAVAALLGMLLAAAILLASGDQAAAAPAKRPIPGIKVNKLLDEGVGPRLVRFKQLRCSLKGKGGARKFFAFGAAGSPQYRITVFIGDWKGFKADYDFHYATSDPLVRLFSPGAVFSNEYGLPGVTWTGKIEFRRGGDVIALAFMPAFNADFSEAMLILGWASCAYPAR